MLDDLQPTLVSLRRLSPDLENLFDNVDPLISAGDEGLPALSRILRGLDPTLAATGPFLQQLNPLLRFLELNQAKVTRLPEHRSRRDRRHPHAAGRAARATATCCRRSSSLGSESLPALRRSPGNRGNAYRAPNNRRDPGTLILPSFDCNHVGREGADEHARLQGPGRRCRSRATASATRTSSRRRAAAG